MEQTDTEDDTTRADVDGLRIRALPKILTKPVEQLSPAQRQTVKDIGLGRLLDLQITNLSRQMGLWLVENFDPRSCTLQLQNGQTIHITVDDVAAVLGLPKGHIEITKRTTKALPEILKEWRWIFEKTIAYITPKALTRKMIEVDAADPWFKRHFALLVMSALIDPMVNGYVNQNYIDHLLDVFYVDSVVLFTRIVPRSFPTFKNWTFKLLPKRERDEIQLGGFGYGHVDTALQVKMHHPRRAIRQF
nr:uncharacterized protein LOC109191529 [Ipomoea batatas]GME21468.1 uncharacterized protein LOC109191529 [Ipomoea batatas]